MFFFKSEGVCQKQAAEEVQIFFNYENKVVKKDTLKKVKLCSREPRHMDSPINNVLVSDFETSNEVKMQFHIKEFFIFSLN